MMHHVRRRNGSGSGDFSNPIVVDEQKVRDHPASNPLRPRAFGGKGAEGLKKQILSSSSRKASTISLERAVPRNAQGANEASKPGPFFKLAETGHWRRVSY